MIAALLACLSLIKTDYAIFLFDNGEKNQVASMLSYAQQHDKSRLEALDFRIVFMGASLDAMTEEPFSHYPDKLIAYDRLGIEEKIDRYWIRDQKISDKSLSHLCLHLNIQKKAWVGVSCSIFGQIAGKLQKTSDLEVVALRDNPNADGETDYFRVAREVQGITHKIALPSKDALQGIDSKKQSVIIGHAPTEEWEEQAKLVDKEAVKKRLSLNEGPIVVYAGVYGDFYEKAFTQFLDLAKDTKAQVVVVPHPRFKGEVEKRVCKNPQVKITTGEVKTMEALVIADVVVTADATSTIVTQASALGKKVLYVNPSPSKVSVALGEKGLITTVSDAADFAKIVQEAGFHSSSQPDVFDLLGIPRGGAQLLWEEWKK